MAQGSRSQEEKRFFLTESERTKPEKSISSNTEGKRPEWETVTTAGKKAMQSQGDSNVISPYHIYLCQLDFFLSLIHI